MPHLIKSGLLAGFVMASSQLTHANPGLEAIQVDFEYTRTLPVEESYSLAQRTAQDACEIAGSKGLTLKAKQGECITELLDQFVTKAGDSRLFQYHTEQQGHAIETSTGQLLANAATQ